MLVHVCFSTAAVLIPSTHAEVKHYFDLSLSQYLNASLILVCADSFNH